MLEENVDILGMVRTLGGTLVNLRQPTPEMFVIEDIARSLSMLVRWTGHVNQFYSVAEHSFLISLNCGDNPLDQLWGLLHDAPESVLGDMSSPLKALPEFAAFRLLERRIMSAICLRFGLPMHEPAIVRQCDTAIRCNERRALRGAVPKYGERPLPASIEGWSPKKAEAMFLAQFHSLYPACTKDVDHSKYTQYSQETQHV